MRWIWTNVFTFCFIFSSVAVYFAIASPWIGNTFVTTLETRWIPSKSSQPGNCWLDVSWQRKIRYNSIFSLDHLWHLALYSPMKRNKVTSCTNSLFIVFRFCCNRWLLINRPGWGCVCVCLCGEVVSAVTGQTVYFYTDDKRWCSWRNSWGWISKSNK